MTKNSDSVENKDGASDQSASMDLETHAVQFDVVHAAELSAISYRRKKINGTDETIEPRDTVALALSGGGIRSAAFNLGMIQAFAEQKLLANIDYLSSVSGGGYIGGWLTSWIYRSGSVREVESLLTPNDTTDKSEPPQIKHLRANSNYLAQRPGVMSPDSWALISIYVRNVFLNLCVVVPTLMLIVSGSELPGLVFQCLARVSNSFAIYVVAYSALVLLVSQLIFLDYRLTLSESPTSEADGQRVHKTKDSEVAFYCSLFTGYLLSLAIAGGSAENNATEGNDLSFGNGTYSGSVSFTVSFLSSLAARLVSDLFQEFSKQRRVSVSVLVSQLIGNLFGTAIVFLFLYAAYFLALDCSHEIKHSIAFPLVMLAFFFAEAARAAVAHRWESTAARELMAVLHGRFLLCGAGWFVVVGAINVPQLLANAIGDQLTRFQVFMLLQLILLMITVLSAGVLRIVAKVSRLTIVSTVLVPAFFLAAVVATSSLYFWMVSSFGTNMLWAIPLASFIAVAIAAIIVDVNVFSLQEMYAFRLAKCFLLASDRRRSSELKLSGSNDNENAEAFRVGDLPLSALKPEDKNEVFDGPLHIINTAVNIARDIPTEQLERKAGSFMLSPLFCGCDLLGFRPTKSNTENHGSEGYGGGFTLGRAMALSGAAVSPSMGYYTSPSMTALLTMLNLRLGAWCGNPERSTWNRSGPLFGWAHLMMEMIGWTGKRFDYVYLSDGGHFDNLGLYELLRRRCGTIFVSDAGADPLGNCNELGMVVRKARTDFNVVIDIDVSDLAIDASDKYSSQCVAIGSITYPTIKGCPGFTGKLIYMKMTMCQNESTDIVTYQRAFPDFPHQSTMNQFYTESQFESYRYLGLTVGRKTLVDDESTYPPRHIRRPPSAPRGKDELKRFFAMVSAGHSFRETDSWETSSSAFNLRYSDLLSRLMREANLQKLRRETRLVAKILAVSERRLFRAKDNESLAEQIARHAKDTATRVRFEERLSKQGQKPRDLRERLAEEAWVVEAMTLMDEVLTNLNLGEYDTNRSRGWMRVIRTWMHTSAFRRVWPEIEQHYHLLRKDFVKRLHQDSEWITSPFER